MNGEEQPTRDHATRAGLVVERAEEADWELQAIGDVSDLLFTAMFFLVTLLVLWHVWKWPLPDRAGPVAHEDRAVQRQAHL